MKEVWPYRKKDLLKERYKICHKCKKMGEGCDEAKNEQWGIQCERFNQGRRLKLHGKS